MAKLTRKKQKIFGSTGDTSQFGQIGSDAAGTPTTTKDIDTIQSLAQYLSGLYAITGDLNEPPRGQDINALYHLITRQLAYLFEAGVPEWEAATEYSSLTSLVLHGGSVWLSLSNTNIGNTPALGSAHWRKVIDQYGTAQESVSTDSRIFDLTGDRVPAIPDDPAGTAYKSNFATTDGWTTNGGTIVATGGKLVCESTSVDFNFSKAGFNFSGASNRLVCIYFDGPQKAPNYSGELYYSTPGHGLSASYRKVFTIPASGGPVYLDMGTLSNGGDDWITSTITSVRFDLGGTIGDKYLLSNIYIGTGAYLSKTIDRAGVPWTNFGALPVDGPFGKGLRFDGRQYLQAPGPMIGATGTIAIKFKRGTIGDIQVLCANYSGTPVTGFNVLLDDNSLQARVYSNSTVIFTHTIATITDTNDHDLIVEFTGSNIVSVLDGVKTQTAGTLETGSGLFTVGRNSIGTVNYFPGTIYAIRADSRVWTDEEIARWSRDPYSEESIPIASTPTPNAIMQWPASGRGLEVINSSAGDCVRVTNKSTGQGVYVDNSSTGQGVYVTNKSTGQGVLVSNNSTGRGVYVTNNSTGQGVLVDNPSTGDGVRVNNTGGGYGVYVIGSGTGKTAKFVGRPIVLPVKTDSPSGGMGEIGEEGCFHLVNIDNIRRIYAYLNGAWRYVNLS